MKDPLELKANYSHLAINRKTIQQIEWIKIIIGGDSSEVILFNPSFQISISSNKLFCSAFLANSRYLYSNLKYYSFRFWLLINSFFFSKATLINRLLWLIFIIFRNFKISLWFEFLICILRTTTKYLIQSHFTIFFYLTNPPFSI